MATPSYSLTRLLENGFLRSFDEEDLMALTEAIVQEVASRRSVGQPLQYDELESHTLTEIPPTMNEVVQDILDWTYRNEHVEIRRLQARHAGLQEE